MHLTRYRYNGPPSGVSLRLSETQPSFDVRLHPGEPVELPADHEYTRVLIALKHLQPLPAPTKPAAKTPKPPAYAKD
jgi:hypothetical protein